MGGFFGVASKDYCTTDLFFGIDYHSHLGTRRGGMAVCGEEGFLRAIHNIENSPFRTKFENDLEELSGKMGIGCISDKDPQPLLINSHLGSFAITTIGKINNKKDLLKLIVGEGKGHFQEMSKGLINSTEVVASLITMKSSIKEGIEYVQELVDGSMSILLLTHEGIYAARDKFGRTPVVVGEKKDAHCISFEDFAYMNLGYITKKELGPGEICFVTPESCQTIKKPNDEMKICSFLWVYYGYPTASYEGINVEEMRYKCGSMLAKRDSANPDIVAGVPDSGIAHAVGYANESGYPFARPFIKYTPTWPRSFMPTKQQQRNLIAKMKLIPIKSLVSGKKLLMIDDSIVRGTQLGETTEFLYSSGAKEVHIRPACPPLLYGCKYLNFSRSSSDLDLITRRVIKDREGDNVSDDTLMSYTDPDSKNYKEMVEEIRKKLNFTSLQFHRLDDLVESVGIEPCKLCTYCWSGKE